VTIPDPDARQGIQAVETAATVLLALERGLGPLSLSQIAAASDMPASKAHRYLVSLARAGLVSQSPATGRYDMGPAMRRLGVESLRRMDGVASSAAFLGGLRDRTAHAVNLAVWQEHGPVVVRWYYGSHALPITVRIGATLPMFSSSVGRVFLAHLPASVTDPVIQAQHATADGSPEDVEAMLEQVRRDGVAVTSGGVIPGIASMAAPVLPPDGVPSLAVAVALPAGFADAATLADIGEDLRATTRAMAERLAEQPGPAASRAG